MHNSPMSVCTYRRDASEYNLFFHRTFFIRIPVAQRGTIYFALLSFPKSRKSELHNVLHGVSVNLKFCSFNTFSYIPTI